MNVKNALFAALCAAATVADAAPTGPYNSYLGNGVGDGSSLEFSNLIGADAGASVQDVTRSGLYGVRAGYGSSNLYGVNALGFWAGANSSYGSNVLAVGTSALRGTWNASNSVAIGANAGRDILNGTSDSVFIGANAGRNANEPSQCLFVGENVGTNAEQVSGRIEIYDLLYADRASGEFRVGSPANGLSFADGTLRIAGRTLAEVPTSVPFDFDLCLSPSGDDANDGLTLATAKRTIAAAVAAANADGGTNLVVAVMPGNYSPPGADFGATNAIVFRAVGGKAATRIVGGANAVCALSSASCTWRGFTFTGFTGKGATDSTWPDYICRFGGMNFDDCDFLDNDVFIDYSYAAYNTCRFDGCTFNRNAFTVRDDALNKKDGILYRSCVLNNCFVDGVTVASNNMFRILNYDIAATNTFMRLPGSLHMCSGISNGTARYQYKNVTIVAPTAWPCERTATSSYICPFPTNEASVVNCFFVIEDATFNDDGTVDAGLYTTTGMPRCIKGAYVVANGSANLTADGVAADADCPSVRDDGLPDYGYKSSGLGAAKTALALKSSLSSLAPLSSLTSHTADTSNPHKVTAEQVGALTTETDPTFSAWTNGAIIVAGQGAQLGEGVYEEDVALVFGASNSGYKGASVVGLKNTIAAQGIAHGDKNTAGSASSGACLMGVGNSQNYGSDCTLFGRGNSSDNGNVVLFGNGNSACGPIDAYYCMFGFDNDTGNWPFTGTEIQELDYGGCLGFGSGNRLAGDYASAFGTENEVYAAKATALGYRAYVGAGMMWDSSSQGSISTKWSGCLAVSQAPDKIFLNSKTSDDGATARTLQSYLDERATRYTFAAPTDAAITAADGKMYSVTGDADGVSVTLPAAATYAQDFVVRLAPADTNGTCLAAISGAATDSTAWQFDYPTGTNAVFGTITAPTYFTFTQTAADRWSVFTYAATKEEE